MQVFRQMDTKKLSSSRLPRKYGLVRQPENLRAAATNLRELARVLGGEIVGGQVIAPGPGHSPRDRSLAVKLAAQSPVGFITHSHAGDPWRVCQDYVLEKLGSPHAEAHRDTKGSALIPHRDGAPEDHERQQHKKAGWLWSRRQPIAGTIAERYLREVRHCNGLLPLTLAFLPQSKLEHHPAMIAAFGIPDEPDPGILGEPSEVDAVHLTLLKPDGGGKADISPNKLIVGRPLGRPIVAAPPNDLLGLVVSEGIEDALSVHVTGLGAWAAGAAGFMPSLADAVPDYIEAITILAHPDKAGRQATLALAAKLASRGIEVRLEGI
jgi:hypothetical protein